MSVYHHRMMGFTTMRNSIAAKIDLGHVISTLQGGPRRQSGGKQYRQQVLLCRAVRAAPDKVSLDLVHRLQLLVPFHVQQRSDTNGLLVLAGFDDSAHHTLCTEAVSKYCSHQGLKIIVNQCGN